MQKNILLVYETFLASVGLFCQEVQLKKVRVKNQLPEIVEKAPSECVFMHR